MRGAKYDFQGKVALVTGAAGGIGRAIARAFARQGASVVVTDMDLRSAEETVRRIQDGNGVAACVQADVTNEDEIRKAVAFAVEHYGKLDFASNNVGIEGPHAPLVDIGKDQWDRVLAVNLTSVYLCMRCQLQQMLKQGSGAIVNMTSAAIGAAMPEMTAYVTTKTGMVGLTRAAAIEVAPKGIRVNAVAPGLVNAGLTDKAPGEFIAAATAAHPIGRIADADEIASAVLWLCSDDASFVVGHTLMVDGGMTIH